MNDSLTSLLPTPPHVRDVAADRFDQAYPRPWRQCTESVLAKIGKVDQLMKNVIVVDWNVINEKRNDWNNRWNRTVER